MLEKRNNYAFIDSNNLYLGVSKDILKKENKIYSGWKLDYRRFRIFLREKFGVTKAFIFIGFKPGNQLMYTKLQEAGYICVFKPTLELHDGVVKGNVDAELVLHSMIELKNYEKAIIVSGDGDFYCLVEYLLGQEKFAKVLVPNPYSYSSLLNRLSTESNNIIININDFKNRLIFKSEK